MTLEKRKKSFETKFALDEEKEFKAKAMASKLFGLWAAEEMELADAEVSLYAKSLIDLSITTNEFEPIISHVQQDLSKAGIKSNNNKLQEIFLEKLEECREKLNTDNS